MALFQYDLNGFVFWFELMIVIFDFMTPTK